MKEQDIKMATNEVTNVESKEQANMLCLDNWDFGRRNQNKGNRNNKPIVLEENIPEPKKNLGF